MLKINSKIIIPAAELNLIFIRSPGPGGQNVNKVASAVQLRFNVLQTQALPNDVKQRLIKLVASKLTIEGDLIIKATQFRTQERNKQDALKRLAHLIHIALIVPKIRKKTKPSKASIERRLASKKYHAKTKSLRSKKNYP